MGVAHGRVDDLHLVGADGRVGIRDLRGATVAADEDELATDAGQLIVTTALAVGAEDALGEACAALGPDGLSRALAFVQPPALSPSLRRRVRADRYDLDALRREAGSLPDVSVPELQRLRRVTWSSAIQVGLLVVAFTILWRAVSDIDLGTLVDELRGATWWLAAAGALVAQTPRLAQAVSCLGAAPLPLALRPVYFLQLAQSYIGLAVPSSAARIAVNVRFFQRQGLAPGGALAVGAVDGLAGFVVQAMVLVGLLVFTPRSLDLDLSLAWGTGIGIVLVVAIVVGVVIAAVAVLRPGLRAQVVAWVRGLVADGIVTVRGLRSPKRLAMVLGGNLGSDLLFATALGLFARAFGTSVGLGDLLLIVISVALLAGLLPVPGGVGVTEGGLALGLVGAGMSEEAAFAAVISYRLCTFYVPPVWGFFALRWLERNQHL